MIMKVMTVNIIMLMYGDIEIITRLTFVHNARERKKERRSNKERRKERKKKKKKGKKERKNKVRPLAAITSRSACEFVSVQTDAF